MARPRNEKSKAKATSNTANVGFEMAHTVLRTLQAAAGASRIPALAHAANLAVQITQGIRKVKRNKDGFELLAIESRELVYKILDENQEDLQAGLAEHLDQVLSLKVKVAMTRSQA